MGAKVPSEGVVEAMAQHTDSDPLELPPLYKAIDPDALDALFHGQRKATAPARVQFHYAGHSVTITEDGAIDVTAATNPEAQGDRAFSHTDD